MREASIKSTVQQLEEIVKMNIDLYQELIMYIDLSEIDNNVIYVRINDCDIIIYGFVITDYNGAFNYFLIIGGNIMEINNYLKKGPATRYNNNVFGHLFLTETELIFVADNEIKFKCNLGKISEVKTVGTNILNIYLYEENKESFRVYNSKDWMELINNKIKESKKNLGLDEKNAIVDDKDFLNNPNIKLSDNQIDIDNYTIKFDDIKDIEIKENMITLVLNSNNKINFKAINLENIVSYIKLQKESESSENIELIPLKFSKIILLILGINIGMMIISYILYSEVKFIPFWFDIFLIIVIYGIWGSVRSVCKFNCPNCKETIYFKFDISNLTTKTTCPNCNKELGIKHGHAYILTPENEKYFNNRGWNNKEQNNQDNVVKNDLSKYDELERLKKLLDDGIITDEEFQNKKDEILNLTKKE